MKPFLTRNPILAYFVLAFAGTWILFSPMVLSRNGLGLLPFTVPDALFALLFILGDFAGPTLAAFGVTWALEGKAGMKALFRRYGQWRVGFRWYLLALFTYPLFNLLGVSLWFGAAPLQTLAQHWSTFFTVFLPAVLIFPALITWGEEPGWRGFALTRMQPIYGPLKASLVVGFMHGLWHLPLFLIVSGPTSGGPFHLAAFALNTLAIMLVTIFWTWVFNGAKGGILIAVLLHASFNAAQGFIPMVSQLPPQATWIGLAMNAGLALGVLGLTRGRLGYHDDSWTPQDSVQQKPVLGQLYRGSHHHSTR